MNVIYRYSINELPRELPRGSRVLHVGIRPSDGIPSMWVLQDTGQPMEACMYIVFGTGKPLPMNPGKYVGTFYDGPLVWHLFERRHLSN